MRSNSACAERVKTQLIPDTKVEIIVERRRPPLEPTGASRQIAKHAQAISTPNGAARSRWRETGSGGGTDAALAALETRRLFLESLGLQGFGGHSNDAEYILVSSIEPRLYLLSRLIIDMSAGKVPLAAR